MATLHAYILRDLLKTFLLALTALTIIFTFGSGFVQVLMFQGITAITILRFLPYTLPASATFVMPLAALYAATQVYGRLASDNELVACRAAGVNVHRLFFSALLVGVFVSAFTLVFMNFIVPPMLRSMETFSRRNFRDIAAQQLLQRGFVHFPPSNRSRPNETKYTLTAEAVVAVKDEELIKQGWDVAEGVTYLHVAHPTYMQIDKENKVTQVITARSGLCRFDARKSDEPVDITVTVDHARQYDVGRAGTIEHQQIKLPVPMAMNFTLQAIDLFTLMKWRNEPWLAYKFTNDITMFLNAVVLQRFSEMAIDQIGAGNGLPLVDKESRAYEVFGSSPKRKVNAIQIEHAEVRQYIVRDGQRIKEYTFWAPSVKLIPRPALSGEMAVEIALEESRDEFVEQVSWLKPPVGERRPITKRSIDGAQPPPDVLSACRSFTIDDLFDQSKPLPVADARLEENRAGLWRGTSEMQRKIVSTMNFRVVFTLSFVAAVVMGAILGVAFRGNRMLAAFLLGMVPLLTMLLIMLIGRTLTEKAATFRAGPIVTWTGLAIFTLSDFVILRLAVRR